MQSYTLGIAQTVCSMQSDTLIPAQTLICFQIVFPQPKLRAVYIEILLALLPLRSVGTCLDMGIVKCIFLLFLTSAISLHHVYHSAVTSSLAPGPFACRTPTTSSHPYTSLFTSVCTTTVLIFSSSSVIYFLMSKAPYSTSSCLTSRGPSYLRGALPWFW
jgi:hypothetical protein